MAEARSGVVNLVRYRDDRGLMERHMSPYLALVVAALFDTAAVEPAPRIPSPLELARASAEAGPRTQDDEPSDWYYRRLKIHRLTSYAMLPLFAFQYAAGAELYKNGGEGGADWAEDWHGVGAATIAGVFAVNVVTGVPNVIEIWQEPRDRKRRLFHASAMLIAAAGFTATGIIADEAEDNSGSGRALHRTVALSSMAVATIGYASMLDILGRD